MTADTTLAPCPTEREQFEAVFSANPYEFSMSRWPDHHRYSWPGQYREYHVQAAWEAWQAARAQAPAPQGPALVPLTEAELKRRSATSPVYVDGVVQIVPMEYRRELEARYRRGWRDAEAAHGITGATHG